MTEATPNAQFRAASFLDGANADYIDAMAARHAADPSSVDAAWAAFFAELNEPASAVRACAGASAPVRPRAGRWTRRDVPVENTPLAGERRPRRAWRVPRGAG